MNGADCAAASKDSERCPPTQTTPSSYLLHHEACEVDFRMGGVKHGDGELRGLRGAGRALQHSAHGAGGAVAAVGDDPAHDAGPGHVAFRDIPA